jgi:hypothetical protein
VDVDSQGDPSEETTLHPDDDEHRALELIAARLRAAEPHLAGMFGIFNRLTAEAGEPPEEDRIRPVRPAGRAGEAGSSAAGHGEPGSSLRVMLVPAALLMALVVVFTVILSGGNSCAPMDRASVFAYHTARVSACEQSQVTSTTTTSR